MIIGAAKSATTHLFLQLCRHPNVFDWRVEQLHGIHKEPSFFSCDDNYAKGVDWYKRLYAGAGSDELCVDASTSYSRWPQVPDAAARMAQHAPSAKIVYILRHPLERAYSHYIHRYMRELYPGKTFSKTFEEHVQEDPMCIDSSLYMRQIERYLDHYPRSSMHVLLTTDFKRNPLQSLRDICTFLEIDPDAAEIRAEAGNRANVSDRHIAHQIRRQITGRFTGIPLIGPLMRRMPRSWRDRAYRALAATRVGRSTSAAMTPPPLTDKVRDRYLAFFEGPNRELARFLGRDLSEWSRKPEIAASRVTSA